MGEPHAPCSCETWTSWKETVTEMLPKLGGLSTLCIVLSQLCACTCVPNAHVEGKNAVDSTCVLCNTIHEHMTTPVLYAHIHRCPRL